MSTEKTLKQENLRYVQAYTILLVTIFWGIARELSIQEILISLDSTSDWLEKLLSATVVASVTYVATIMLTGVIPSKWKYVLVFWRFNNTLPGHRAFSRLMAQDPRIDTDALIAKYGELPQEPVAQNKLWYRIYQKHEMEKTVLEAQKNFLLMREMTATTVILMVVLAFIGWFLFSEWRLLAYYITGLSVLAALTATAGRNYGERLVTNVLSIDSTDRQ